jgi:succinylglutamate desuccinylase
MDEEILELKGEENGPTSMILVGVHGNEKCGIEALRELLPSLQITRGSVFIGYGNPSAVEQGVRFVDSNLNRMFKPLELLSEKDRGSYEYKRAQLLKDYLKKSGALLDVHASLTPNSQPFIICEANAKGVAEYLPIDLVVSGFDRIEPGGTDYYMNSIGKVGICVECGYVGDSGSTEIAKESILNFLKACGHLANDKEIRKQLHIEMYDIYKTKSDTFVLSKPFKDFEEISTGQIIGTDGGKEVRAERNSVILFARDRDQAGDEAFLIGKKKYGPG